ncbi:cytoskeletal protein binding protein, partial [Coemansia sp. RSA 1933]
MPLVEVRRAIYSYTPAAEDELSLKDGDVLYILDNDDPDWLEAKKKQFNIDDPMEQGLVPANHTEPVASIARAKALYDYEPVENEETTLAEGEDVLIIEEDDPDWFMTKSNGGYGFIPKAYVEIVSRDTPAKTVDSETPMDDHLPPPQIPAAELSPPAPPTLPQQLPPAPPTLPPQPPQLPPAPPALPKIAQPAAPISPQVAHSAPMSPMASAQPAETISHFNVVEGKKKKKGTMVTLGISNTTFVVDSRNDAVAPKKFAMGDVTKCTAKKGVLGVEIGGYAPAAFDFTCASNAEAESIMDAVNAARRGTFVGKKHVDAAGLPIPPATAQRDRTASIASSANKPLPPHPRAPTTGEYARVLYDFSSEDPEELTVSEGARVLVLDKSDPEWWQVQLEAPNGPTGLVPSAYVGPPYPHAPNSPTASAIDHVFMSAASTAAAAAPLPPPPPPPPQAPPLELHGYGDMPPLPARTETVRKAASEAHSAEQTKNTYVPPPAATAALPGPDMNKVRTWTDGSGAYTVEAQFLSLDSQNNVNLHKTNGKKINVPLSKFAPVDREYVYRVTGNAPEQPPKPQTARQRQLESARKTPGTRIINYDWDWFDFFTLKAGISADSALKYATSFVAERLDDQSIPEIDASLMNQLGVKQHDVSNIQRAFRVHQGLPGESTASQISDMFATSSAPAPIQDAQGISRRIAPDRPAPGMPTVDLLDATMEPPRLPARSPTTANAPASPVQPKVDNNPWGMDSNLDRRVGQRQQIEDDEALARRLQQEEKDNAKRDKKPHFWNRHANDSKNTKPDPFSSLDGPSGSSSGGYQRTGTAAASTTGGGSKQPLNLASGSRKNNKTQISFVDPSQLRSAQQKLSGQTSPRVSSPLLDTSSSSARGAAAIDQAFGLSSGSPRSPVYNPPPRARPTARQQQSQPQQQQASTAIPT